MRGNVCTIDLGVWGLVGSACTEHFIEVAILIVHHISACSFIYDRILHRACALLQLSQLLQPRWSDAFVNGVDLVVTFLVQGIKPPISWVPGSWLPLPSSVFYSLYMSDESCMAMIQALQLSSSLRGCASSLPSGCRCGQSNSTVYFCSVRSLQGSGYPLVC